MAGRKIVDFKNYKVFKTDYSQCNEIHVYLEKYAKKKAYCSHCNYLFSPKQRHSSQIIVVQDLPISDKQVFLHVQKEKYKCPNCHAIRVEKVDWLSLRSRVTKRYQENIGRLTAIANNSDVAWFLGIDDETVYREDKKLLTERAKKN